MPQGGGSSSTPPTTREWLNGSGTVLITDAGQARLPWSHAADSHLVDLTDPTEPAIITAGVYACVVTAAPADLLTTGGFWNLDFELDFFGAAQNVNQDATQTAAMNAANELGATTLPLTYYIPAGGTIVAAVTNRDGVASRHFKGSNLYIQRIA